MKRAERAEALLRDVVKQIERGVIVVQIRLRWGTVEWRASMKAVHGKALDGAPFTIEGVDRRGLMRWLNGIPLRLAFPNMDPGDRVMLATGSYRYVRPQPPEPLVLETVPHPGQVVLEYLDSYGWTKEQLATRTGLPLQEIEAICDGKHVVTPAIAQLFEKTLRRPARLWLKLQEQYDARQSAVR